MSTTSGILGEREVRVNTAGPDADAQKDAENKETVGGGGNEQEDAERKMKAERDLRAYEEKLAEEKMWKEEMREAAIRRKLEEELQMMIADDNERRQKAEREAEQRRRNEERAARWERERRAAELKRQWELEELARARPSRGLIGDIMGGIWQGFTTRSRPRPTHKRGLRHGKRRSSHRLEAAEVHRP
ncbi:hypothetical protein NMY22_g5856 [Coprinellus aureogranulatus]|nr:hypothetical protein NMY22_g5856 [Coprinellus aureogranulatus]